MKSRSMGAAPVFTLCAFAALACAAPKVASAQALAADQGGTRKLATPLLPSYEPRQATPPRDAGYVLPDGTIRIVGVGDMRGIIGKLDDLYATSHPGAKFVYVKGNSYGALYSLMWGSTAFAPMDLDYQSNLVYTDIVHGPSFEIRVAHASLARGAKLSPLAIVVNKGNPIDTLSMAQLTSIFTEPLRRPVYSHWSQLGAKGALGDSPIHPVGLPWSDHYPSQDPTFGEYFFTRKLGGGQPSNSYAQFNTYGEVLKDVAADPVAIGVIAANEATAEVKVVGIASGDFGERSMPTAADVASGRYPLDRSLYLYGRLVSGKPFDPFVKEYLRMALSKEGQQIVADDPRGYIPLNAVEDADELEKLQ